MTAAQYATLAQPVESFVCPASNPVSPATVPAGTYYWLRSEANPSAGDSFCITRWVSDGTFWTSSETVGLAAPPTSHAPQNIPVFGPIGLLSMLLGLLWFGKRPRKG